MKKSTTRRALLMSVMSLFLCFTMLVGTTFAWFTDEVKSGTNQIVAGNLDVELEYWNGTAYTTVEGATELFDPDALWEPGHAEVVYLKISNKGTLALKYLFAINLLGETIGKTKDNADIKLSEHLQFGIVADVAGGAYGTDRAAAIAAVTNPQPLTQALSNQHGYASMKNATPMLPNDEKTLAVVVWMPTSVGNEANHDGENVPSIFLGLNLLATQVENEQDSFGSDYDFGATFPLLASGVAENTGSGVEITVRNVSGEKVGSAVFPADSLDDTADQIKVNIEKTALDSANVTVTSDQDAQTYEVTVEGLKAGNTANVKVSIRVGAGLTGIKLYHKDQEITVFNYDGEYITYETTSFSPFTVVYDKVSVPEEDPSNTEKPKASVEAANQYEGVAIEWKSYGGIPTPNANQQIESAYVFTAPHNTTTVQDSVYKDWICDYYVSMDRDVPAGSVFLAGNYGDFGWIGFENPEAVSANVEVPLLGSVMGEWTYEEIVSFVGTFTCGVSHLDESLNGATFTVILRLTNPENSNETYDANTVTYTFGTGVSVIDGVAEQ